MLDEHHKKSCMHQFIFEFYVSSNIFFCSVLPIIKKKILEIARALKFLYIVILKRKFFQTSQITVFAAACAKPKKRET